MASAARLYTPEILALTIGLSRFAWDDALPHTASARSRSCGSTLMVGIETDPAGRISRLGIKAQACAIGQAAAATFAADAIGRDAGEVMAARAELAAWLEGNGPMPDWPGIAALAPARDYPARHGAILLAWDAACEVLSYPDQRG